MAETKASKKAAENRQCFFITPIGDDSSPERRRADWIFNLVIEPACKAHDLLPERADKMSASAMIGTNIFRAIKEAPVCVADLTGLNPNVLYEMGVRHTLSRPIVHIAQTGTRLPFDTAAHLTHFYDLDIHGSVTGLASAVEAQLGQMLQPNYEVSNPFTQALGAIELRDSQDPMGRMIADVDERLRTLERNMVPLPPPLLTSSEPTLRLALPVLRSLERNYANADAALSASVIRLGARHASQEEADEMLRLLEKSSWPNKSELMAEVFSIWPILDR